MKYFTLLIVLIAYSASAQWNDQEYLLEYKKAVQLYASGKGAESLEKLVPLTGRNYSNAVVPYAMYHFALISDEGGRGADTRSMLRDLFQRFPDWEKMDEAYYLYGLSNLKDKYYEEGLSYMERISSGELKENKEDASRFYISAIENITLLKDLNRKFPLNNVIAETLVRRIQSRSYNTKADLELSDQLTNRFKIKSPGESQKNSGKNVNYQRSFDDGVIDFGVLLPFGLDKFNLREASTDQRFVYDLYYGMSKATERLKEEKINVRLLGFDVGNSSESMKKYLDRSDFKQLDVVVGPLYGGPNKLLEEYAAKNRIYQIHPMSNNSELLVGSDARFLVQPSNITQANASLDFVEEQTRKKDVSIYYGESKKDSILAAVYGAEARKRGFKVNELKRFRSLESISTAYRPGHVFFSTEASAGPGVVRALSQRRADSLLIATSSSFNLESGSRGVFNRRLFLISPEFTDSESQTLREFKMKYIEEMNALPSYYAYMGYDLVLFYGRMLKDGKDIFRLNLNESPRMDDLLLSGFDYSENSQENKIVPVIRYSDGIFELVN